MHHRRQRVVEFGGAEPVAQSLQCRGTTRWLARSSSAARSRPIARPSAAGGPQTAVGRCRARPIARVSSPLVTGRGAVALTARRGARFVMARRITSTSSASVIQLTNCRPEPSRPPSPNRNSAGSGGGIPRWERAPRPERRQTTRIPASAAGRWRPPRRGRRRPGTRCRARSPRSGSLRRGPRRCPPPGPTRRPTGPDRGRPPSRPAGRVDSRRLRVDETAAGLGPPSIADAGPGQVDDGVDRRGPDRGLAIEPSGHRVPRHGGRRGRA